MTLHLRSLVLAAALIALSTAPAQTHPLYGSGTPTPGMIVEAPGIAPNNAHALKQHYVVLVSLDGFRYDYPEEYGATNLLALAHEGARATHGMMPSYPSLTFPNHYTLVTGLYPEHHGIVRNSFYDPARKETYEYKTAKNTDGTWYGGVPLWSLAEQQGMRSATFMWPGSEAEIAGERPAYYAHFVDNLDGHVGLDQIDAWLKLPPAQRPHLITFYMPTADHAGHWYGPDSVEEITAVHTLDALMGELRQRLTATGLPIDLIILADHGMVRIDRNWINFDELAPALKGVEFHDGSIYAKDEAQAQLIYEQLKAANDPRISVYRRKDVPPELHFSSKPTHR